jgi:NAD(P)-dependent dehydrogenase (short-subunit alcohol dehydrogenase family)
VRFAGKVAIVTGAAGGIGLATAMRFASEGARVVLADVDEEKVAAAASAVRQATGGEARGAVCNVGVEADVERIVDETFAREGGLDVVVNNAGVMVFKPIDSHTEADVLHVLRVDFLGPFWFTKQALRKCRPGAAVVNVASIHALQTTALVASYAAAKAALLALTRASAIEGKPRGLRVNAVLPGAIETPMLRENPNVRSGAEVLAAADVGRADEVAAAIAFLASDDASFITGAELRVDGGRLARL